MTETTSPVIEGFLPMDPPTKAGKDTAPERPTLLSPLRKLSRRWSSREDDAEIMGSSDAVSQAPTCPLITESDDGSISSSDFGSFEGDEPNDQQSFDIGPESPREPSFRKRPLPSILIPSSCTPIVDETWSWKRLPAPDMKEIEKTIVSCSTEAATKAAVKTKETGHREVRFDAVAIRLYNQTIGDNPAVSIGTPIQLDWQYSELPIIALEDFELQRATMRRPHNARLLLNYFKRRNILSYYYGYTEDQLVEVEKAMDKIRRQRAVTAAFSAAWKVEDCLQSAARKTKRALRRSQTS